VLFAPEANYQWEPLTGPRHFPWLLCPCHGLDGKGHGPAAPALKSKVADLTLLTKRVKGEFPRDRVRDILEGQETPAAHGSNELPVWGPVFHQLEAIRTGATCGDKISSLMFKRCRASDSAVFRRYI
jgi:hypothetical protein